VSSACPRRPAPKPLPHRTRGAGPFHAWRHLTSIAFKDGRRPPHPEHTHPRVKFAQIRGGAATLPPHPSLVDYVTKVATWPMYKNDAYGDCVWAAAAHVIEAATTYGPGETVMVTDADVIKAYSAVTGFDPDDPSTDQGTVIQDALSYWRKTGIGGHKILAYAEVDISKPDEVAEALYLFGHLELGINFPGSAMDQFDAGQPWDVVPGAQIEGGHAVNLGQTRDVPDRTPFSPRQLLTGKNARGNYEIITWGRVQEMTPAFWDKYVEEAWIVITPEWEQATGGSPAGIDKAKLGGLFTLMTGEPSPFDTSAPDPAPAPVATDDVWPEIVAFLTSLWVRLCAVFGLR
jgi:hypothetical protein